LILADVRAGIGAAVGGGVEPVPAEEVVLDELFISVPPRVVVLHHELRRSLDS
jgi:hypothetical protein